LLFPLAFPIIVRRGINATVRFPSLAGFRFSDFRAGLRSCRPHLRAHGPGFEGFSYPYD
jgi:hypothetical protein